MAAAALPALPEATLLAPPRGALAATRHFATWGEVHSTNVYLTAHIVRGGHIHGDALVPSRFLRGITYKIVPKRHGE
jgi:hypothetical protein